MLAPSRILSFWQALEAVIGASQKSRLTFFAALPSTLGVRRWPAQATLRRAPFNAMTPLRRYALKLWRRLLSEHSALDLAVDHLYDKRRGKAAHADKISLEFDFSADVARQFADAALLRYAARAAVESAWSA